MVIKAKVLVRNGVPVNEYELQTKGVIEETNMPKLRQTYDTHLALTRFMSLRANSPEIRGKMLKALEECELVPVSVVFGDFDGGRWVIDGRSRVKVGENEKGTFYLETTRLRNEYTNQTKSESVTYHVGEELPIN